MKTGWTYKRSDCSGTTLVELLIIVLIIAVLSSTAISILGGSQKQRAAQEAARKVATDISYARSEAMAYHQVRYVVFRADLEVYGICDQSGLIVNPLSKNDYTVKLDKLFAGTGIDLARADFGGSDSLHFDDSGLPFSEGTVEINAGNSTWKVIVEPTGHVSISL